MQNCPIFAAPFVSVLIATLLLKKLEKKRCTSPVRKNFMFT